MPESKRERDRDSEDEVRSGLSRRDVVLGGAAMAGGLGLGSLLGPGVAGAASAAKPLYPKYDKRWYIYFATHAIVHPFWAIVQKGAVEGAKQANLKMKWTQDIKFSIPTTINRMNAAIGEKPDLLVFTATEPKDMRPQFERAQKLNIPVIAINVNDPAPKAKRVPYILYIGGDEEEGGRAAAEAVLKEGKPKRAACFNTFPGHVGLELRCKGWGDVMKAAGVAVDTVDASGGPAKAASATVTQLTQHKDTEAIFTVSPGPEGFGGVLQALRGKKLNGKVKLVTFDLTPEILQAIKDGDAVGCIDQQPYLQGYLPCQLARAYLDWGAIPHFDIKTGPAVVDKSNVDIVIEGGKAGYR